MRYLPAIVDPRALVGAATADDAAVYRVADDLAVVATVDYITPVVDDPYAWGAVAAANALSDVYAMGARPIFALNVVNFPRATLSLDVLARVLQGGAAKTTEAGIPVLGGHSIDDPEPKFGLVAVGTVHPNRVVRNVGAQPGDALVLTKPLGMGIVTTAIKRGLASAELTDTAVAIMATLNRAASDAMVASGAVHAGTDVTGFGLLGHLAEMVGAGDVGARLMASAVPVLEPVWDLVAQDAVPGGTRRNLQAVDGLVRWSAGVTDHQRLVLADAQTSGGLLMAVTPDGCDALLAALHAGGVAGAARIGTFTDELGGITVEG